MVRPVFVAALAAAMTAFAPSASARPSSEAESLQRYLSSMSWPMRASLLRANSVTDRIDSWIMADDPPGLGQIALTCRNLRAVEPRSHVLQITAPPRLAGRHARLIRAYAAARAGCAQARLTALATRTAMERGFTTKSAADKRASDYATAVARRDLGRFARGPLHSFVREVLGWRSAALAEVAALGVTPPAWLTELTAG
jgi:hypothetical protein